jgi:hypothetical protein
MTTLKLLIITFFHNSNEGRGKGKGKAFPAL